MKYVPNYGLLAIDLNPFTYLSSIGSVRVENIFKRRRRTFESITLTYETDTAKRKGYKRRYT